MGDAILVNESKMAWGDGARSFGRWIRVGPCTKELTDGRFDDVGTLIEVNRAWPEIVREFLSQVADGFTDTPAE